MLTYTDMCRWSPKLMFNGELLTSQNAIFVPCSMIYITAGHKINNVCEWRWVVPKQYKYIPKSLLCYNIHVSNSEMTVQLSKAYYLYNWKKTKEVITYTKNFSSQLHKFNLFPVYLIAIPVFSIIYMKWPSTCKDKIHNYFLKLRGLYLYISRPN